MKVILNSGEAIELGITEISPTVGIVDYSRRVTDDFGVTTVVRRGFSRQMSLRFALPFDAASTVQRQLADVRATPALWVADDRYRALSVRGIYKDFDINLEMPPLSYCSLTIDGLAESDVAPDPGGDPAVAGMVSTLRLIQPVTIDDGVLTVSNVPENDAPAWAAGTTYGDAARVIAGHRVFESLTAGNVGNDPLTSTGKWVEVGPTNRWAAFDQALGTAMAAAGPIVVTLASGTADALALLDVTGVAVRVQANGYDRTLAVAPGALTFTDLPGGAVTVTIAGPGTVSVGTLLIGRMVALGVTEASPTAGITDYSRKEVDDFGEVTIVQRAWSKRMQARALIRADAVDTVFDRIAALRAVPALWIGDADSDALTIYGFFKDFSIEIGDTTAKLSLTVEGLSRAAKIEPITAPVSWEEVTDPHGTKPANNADVTGDNTSKDTNAVGGRPALDLLTGVDTALGSLMLEMLRNATFRGESDAIWYMPDGTPVRTVTQVLSAIVDGQAAYIADLRQVDGNGNLKATTLLNSKGHIIGTTLLNDGTKGSFTIVADEFTVIDPAANADDPPTVPFRIAGGEVVMDTVKVRRLDVGVVTTGNIAPGQITGMSGIAFADVLVTGNEVEIASVANLTIGDSKDGRATIELQFTHDATAVPDAGMLLRCYVDQGSGYGLVAQETRGARVGGGDIRYIFGSSMSVVVNATGKVNIRFTGQAVSIGGGGINQSTARNVRINVNAGYR